MDTSELLRRAWEAVEKSGVPEPLHGVALQAAVEDLRAQEGADSPATARGAHTKGSGGGKAKSKDGTKAPAKRTTATVDEDTFFQNLAHESGVPEKDLRDVLSLSDGAVHVDEPTKNLGKNRAAQARTVIALVAGARGFGLGEQPIDHDAVRDEVKRKKCYDQANYALTHLGRLQGFRPGAVSGQLAHTSKWVGEFVAAVNQALGRTTKDES